jgi:predicted amidophosphoribosyltransferase
MPMRPIHFKLPSHPIQRVLLGAQTLLLRSYCRCCSSVLGVNAVYAVLCPACAESLPGKNIARCGLCAMPSALSPCLDCKKQQRLGTLLHPTYAVCDYEASTKEWLYFFKSTGHGPSALFMAQEIAKVLPTPQTDSNKHPARLIPVPSSRERFLQRGFNPAAILAQATAAALNASRSPIQNAVHKSLVRQHHYAEVCLDLIMKSRHTNRQGTLSRQDRLQNLDHAFEINSQLSPKALEGFKDQHLIVIDDVITTGATMNQMCAVLSTLNPAIITRVAFARTGLPRFLNH